MSDKNEIESTEVPAQPPIDLAPPLSTESTEPTTSTSPADPSDPAEIDRLRRVPFGSRYLTNPDDVYSFNAWDHVVPPPEWEVQAKETLGIQREGKVSDQMKWAYNNKPSIYWNRFYDINKAAFFKDRNWLRLEFPELLECAKSDAGPKLVVEIGCGAGNTVFPLMSKNENPDLVVHACDYAQSAVEVVKANPMFPVPEHGKGILHSSVWDLSTPPIASSSQESSTGSSEPKTTQTLPEQAEEEPVVEEGDKEEPATSTAESRWKEKSSLPEGIEPGTVDIAVMIFVMSALHPMEWQRAIANAYKMLKPNGLLFIRDYGRYDLAQLRIKKGRMLEENFYIRGDGTRVYFFEAAELSEMLTGAKDAYTPMDDPEPKIEIDNHDSGVSTPLTEGLDSRTGTPAPGTPSEEKGLYRHKPDDMRVETERLSKLALSVGAEDRPSPVEPLSTRFRPASPGMGSLPRTDFASHQSMPPLSQDAAPSSEGETAYGNPFGTPHAELGLPPMPLFRIDQLGVDRRMLVNRKRQLKMYRIWMQVKARKLV